jgi:hypothetical protein
MPFHMIFISTLINAPFIVSKLLTFIHLINQTQASFQIKLNLLVDKFLTLSILETNEKQTVSINSSTVRSKMFVNWMQFMNKRKYILMTHVVLYALTTCCVVFFSYSHPFLISDNRHYTFYIWRRLLSKPHFR